MIDLPPVEAALFEVPKALNQSCFCFSLDRTALAQALDAQFGDVALAQLVAERCPYVFAAQPVFVAAGQLQTMAQLVQAVEFDLRAYTCAGDVMWMAARLSQGQTTNFRTPGGGFAPVYSAPPNVCAGAVSQDIGPRPSAWR